MKSALCLLEGGGGALGSSPGTVANVKCIRVHEITFWGTPERVFHCFSNTYLYVIPREYNPAI
jgi:hypothetical protein